MLSRWAAVKSKDPDKMTTRDVIVHTSGNVFAGSDTTTIALRAMIYFLIRNPSKMAELIAEIDAADKDGKLSKVISYKESTTYLPYVAAVSKEAIRTHPSVGLIMERHVSPGGAQICGQYIPGGTIVGINPGILHHDPSVFPDPESFIPERWLESPPEKLAEMEMSFFSFGAGSRTCVGKYISLIEMQKIVPQLLREFEVRLADPEREWKLRNHWFVQQSGLACVLTKRKREG
jgi:cytochrome P450